MFPFISEEPDEIEEIEGVPEETNKIPKEERNIPSPVRPSSPVRHSSPVRPPSPSYPMQVTEVVQAPSSAGFSVEDTPLAPDTHVLTRREARKKAREELLRKMEEEGAY